MTIERRHDGALLQELSTRDGAGTLITASTQEQLRAATVDDVVGILDFLLLLGSWGPCP